MTPIAPLVDGQVVIFAKDQPEYFPLPAVVSPDGTMVTTEWELSAEELQRVLEGGRIRLRLWTFGHPLQPVLIEVVS